MEYEHISSESAFKNIVREAVLAQLTENGLVDLLTKAVLKRVDEVENAALLKILENENEASTVSVEDFLQALKSQ